MVTFGIRSGRMRNMGLVFFRSGAAFLAMVALAAAFTSCADPSGAPAFTVRFDINGGTGPLPPSQTVDAGSAVTLPVGAGLSRAGYVFGGWNEAADGSRRNFNAGATFTPSGDMTLFARWNAPALVTVSFDPNGGGGFEYPLETVQGSPVTLPNGARLYRAGFVFGGWNTNAAGTGTNHAAGAPFTPHGDVTLFARWIPTFTVLFHRNGGDGDVPDREEVHQGLYIILPDGAGLSRSGHAFDGWSESPTGLQNNHIAGTFFRPTRNLTLFARWVPVHFTVTFDANGGDGTPPAPIRVMKDSSETLPDGTGLSKSGFAFGGWNTAADGEGTNFNAGAAFATTANVTLFARWMATVTFDANGGDGAVPDPLVVVAGSSAALPDGDGLSRAGFVFDGWNTNAAGTGTAFAVGAAFTPTGHATLYANWLVTWSAARNDEMPTTAIEFTFDAPVFGLTAADITIAAGTGSATPGALTGGGTAWSLAIEVESHGNVSVSINRRGIEVGPRTVAVVSDLIRIPGGTFQMGSPAGTPNSQSNERPVRAVTISAFSMRRFLVTQGEWYDVMGTNPSRFYAGYPAIIAAGANWRNLPVERVSWYDALVFSNRLSIARGLTPAYSIGGSTNPDDWGLVPTSSDATWNAVTIVAGSTGYRLPTEAQWEFAARGGNGSPGNFTFSGSNNAAEVAWHDANSGGRTHEVGRLRPNALGLYDMSGNVWEWVWDWMGTYPSTPQTNPTGPAAGDTRVLRGGSWRAAPEFARSAIRNHVSPVHRDFLIGFRLVRP